MGGNERKGQPRARSRQPEELKELLRTRHYFKAIADTTNDMIHLNDLDGRIVYVNAATERVLGYGPDELLNRHAFGIIHPDDQEKVQYDISLALTESHLPPQDVRLLHRDGTYVETEVRGFVIDEGDGGMLVGAIIRDVRQRKQDERRLQLYRHQLEILLEERTHKLRQAMDEIETLRSIVPLCSFCKKVREEDGYWEQVDIFIGKHLEADISHSICPDCLGKHYPQYFKE